MKRTLFRIGLVLLLLIAAVFVFVRVQNARHPAQAAAIALTLVDRIPATPGQRYLDVGCGAGHAAGAVAASRALDVTGIDIDEARIRKALAATDRPNLHFRVMDATRLDFPDGSFDIASTSLVLHEIPQPERAFAEMVRVLRPGGHLIVHDFCRAEWFPAKDLLTEKAFERMAAENKVAEVYRSRSWYSIDCIWRKPSTGQKLQQ